MTSFGDAEDRYTLIFSIKVTSSLEVFKQCLLFGRFSINVEVTSFGDAEDRYTLIFSIEVTSSLEVFKQSLLFGRFSINVLINGPVAFNVLDIT